MKELKYLFGRNAVNIRITSKQQKHLRTFVVFMAKVSLLTAKSETNF